VGAGAGIGGTTGKRFAEAGYHSVLCRRSDADGLNAMVTDIRAGGGEATGFLLNAADDDVIEETVEKTEAEIGPIDVVIFNLGAQIGSRPLAGTSYKAFELGWRMACFGLFRVASAVTPHMVERGHGTIIVTSATAAVRGNAGQHSHAAAMGGRRMLCQTLNAEFSSQGIHVAHVLVDGMVDAPDTVGKMLGAERFQEMRETRGRADGIILPEKVAETYLHLVGQHRSTWTFEMDLRSFSDTPWWNHA
jgi:NAD(P)-dependent dehydrogenase (short-subunit alcohol dehydrogenase family)